MTRPRIGITCDLNQREFPEEPRKRDRHVLMDAYIEAVMKGGGLPFLLPCAGTELDALAFLDGIDALIISGGGHDLEPELYNEKRVPACGPANPRRAQFELELCRGAMDRDMPVLGICGGMQVLNVAALGTLYQDIASEVKNALPHKPKDEKKATYVFHCVEVFPSILQETIGADAVTVNSHHHQSVKDLGPGMRLSAQSEDGIVEAIESPSHRFVIGVQWHPESMSAYGYGDNETAEHLLSRLVEEARDYALDLRRTEVV